VESLDYSRGRTRKIETKTRKTRGMIPQWITTREGTDSLEMEEEVEDSNSTRDLTQMSWLPFWELEYVNPTIDEEEEETTRATTTNPGTSSNTSMILNNESRR
jgi:hypothetical protein